MRADIHPKYSDINVQCSCGNAFATKSTLSGSLQDDILKVEVCSNCHPFYTGQQKLVDTSGRVERFNSRYAIFDDMGEGAK